jgi:NAD(P)-dependent dehydrogenase (short-subunit alcohol dehydrogenase family)
MDLGLKGKVAVVTGGNQGVGRIIVHTLAQEGVKTVIADVNTEGGDKVLKEVKDIGSEAVVIKTDVSKLEDTERLCASTLEKFGRIDILVHNAAIFSVKPFMDTPAEKWKDIIGVSQIGAFNCCRSVFKQMIEQRDGRIIFIGSDAGRIGDPYQPIYASGKGGIIAFAKSIAQDIGPKGITVNVVSPALVATEENKSTLEQLYGLNDEKRSKKLYAAYPMRRLGTSEDVANLVVFLCSNKAGFITGQTISVNGGYCML